MTKQQPPVIPNNTLRIVLIVGGVILLLGLCIIAVIALVGITQIGALFSMQQQYSIS